MNKNKEITSYKYKMKNEGDFSFIDDELSRDALSKTYQAISNSFYNLYYKGTFWLSCNPVTPQAQKYSTHGNIKCSQMTR